MSLQVFTKNSKTILSVDFNREQTCYQICEYCYVTNLERIYSAYADKIKKNDNLAKDNPKTFAQQLNSEYKKIRQKKENHLNIKILTKQG
mgnify:CR=1 FL=1